MSAWLAVLSALTLGGCVTPFAQPSQSRVVVWGGYQGVEATLADAPTETAQAVALGGGRDYVVALLRDGTVRVWGAPDAPTRAIPNNLPRLRCVAAGASHCAGVTESGRLVEWGSLGWGGKDANRVRALSNLVAVSAGLESTLVLREDGTVDSYCSDLFTDWAAPMPAGLSNVTAIAAGAFHNLALRRDGTLVAWGAGTRDYGGQAGQVGQLNIPRRATNVVAIAAGGLLSMALNRDGEVIVWGGVKEIGQPEVPVECKDFVAIACGWTHFVALRRDGTVVVWGLGAGQPPAGLRAVRLIGAGNQFTVAVTRPPPRGSRQ